MISNMSHDELVTPFITRNVARMRLVFGMYPELIPLIGPRTLDSFIGYPDLPLHFLGWAILDSNSLGQIRESGHRRGFPVLTALAGASRL